MITRQEMEAVANMAITEYFESVFPLVSEHVPRERLATAHNHARRKTLNKLSKMKLTEWDIN